MNAKNPYVHVMKISCVEPGVEASHCYFVIHRAHTRAVQLHGVVSAETLDALSLDHNVTIEIHTPRKEPPP